MLWLSVGFRPFRSAKNRYLVVCLFIFSYVMFASKILANPGIATGPQITSGYRLDTFFLAGWLLWTFKDKVELKRGYFWSFLVLLVGLTILGNFTLKHSGGVFYLSAPFVLPYLTFYLGCKTPYIHLNQRYDLSYGFYIYGTLFLNVLLHFELNNNYFIYLL